MLKADLHVHSTVSDGSVSIPELIRMAARRGIDVIAVTDHDTLSHMAQIPGDDTVRVIAGIEISAVDRRNNMRAHILGYGIQNPDTVTAFTQPLLLARHANSMRQIEILRERGFSIPAEALRRADGKYIYKQHIMDYLVSTGQAAEMFGGFYQATFKNSGICAFDIEYLDVFDAVSTIRRAGGKAVLAHSGQQQNFYLIPQLAACGLNGLEYQHHTHSEKDRDIIREYARQHGLFLTGGSDYHGKYEDSKVELGDFISEESGVIAIC